MFRTARRLLGCVFVATLFVTGAPLASARGVTVDVSVSSVQLTGAIPEGLAGAESNVESRTLETPSGLESVTDPRQPAPPGYRAVVDNPNDAQMVGFVWSGSPNASLQLRSSTGTTWSPWLDLHADSYGGADPGEGNVVPGVGPIWIGNDAHQIEVRVDSGALAELRVDALHIDVGGSGAGIAAAGAALARPGMISRAEWRAAGWGSGVPDCGTGPSTAPARYAVVHHTAGSNSYSPSEAYGIVRAIQQFEMSSRGFCDIAYNFLVSRYGQVFEGRSGSIYQTVIGAHARGSNTGSIGVALMGQHQPGAQPPAVAVTGAEYAAVRNLIAWKFSWHGIDPRAQVTMFTACVSDANYSCKYPAGSFLSIPPIVGHRDVSRTSCPGAYAYNLLPRLRAQVPPPVARSGPFAPLDASRWAPNAAVPALLTLDAFGGLHPGGGARAVAGGAYTPGWGIARDIAGTPSGGQVLDGWGGIRPFGAAPRVTAPAYWRGWDIARGISLASSPTMGHVLDAWGGVRPFGGAATPTRTPYWKGWDIARDIVTLPDGRGGYVLDGWGGIWPFGTAPRVTGPYWKRWDIARAIALNPSGPGLYLLDGFGSVRALGGAPPLQSTLYVRNDVARDLVVLPGGRGYVLDADGRAWRVGSAPAAAVFLSLTGYGLGRGIVAG